MTDLTRREMLATTLGLGVAAVVAPLVPVEPKSLYDGWMCVLPPERRCHCPVDGNATCEYNVNLCATFCRDCGGLRHTDREIAESVKRINDMIAVAPIRWVTIETAERQYGLKPGITKPRD